MMDEFENVVQDQDLRYDQMETDLKNKIEQLTGQKIKLMTIRRQKSPDLNGNRFKFVKGDDIDELFAKHLNLSNLDLEVKRLSKGNYLFGTKRIQVKILNSKVLIRVGGGYMGADEFIEQYGKMETVKLQVQ